MVQFYLWSKFYFLCFKLIIHYHTQKPTYLGSMGNCLSRTADMPTSDVDSGDSPFFTFPLPHLQQPHYPHHPSSTLPRNWCSHLRELCEVLHEVNAIKIHPSWIRTLTHVQPIIVESNSKLMVLLNNWVTQEPKEEINFLSQVIFVFHLFQCHYHTPKQKKNKNYLR